MMQNFNENPGIKPRQFPRREMQRKVGVLYGGTYFICQSGEIGEGGMSIITDYVLSEGRELIVTLHIPGGSFAFLRATVRSVQKREGDTRVAHSLIFKGIEFSVKRQIRSYVSARSEF